MFSRRSALREVDGRSREARIIKQVVADLTDQLGGEARVTAAQSLLIHASALLAFRLRAALDRYSRGDDCESLDRHVVALQNGLRGNLTVLGMQRVDQAAPSLAAYLELKAERREAAA